MGLLDIARDTLKEIPMADILRERLSLAFDMASQSERENEKLRSEKARLEAELDIMRMNEKQTRLELETLKDRHAEDVRVSGGAEFRRGIRTNMKWIAFCPKCHAPATTDGGDYYYGCSDNNCAWTSRITGYQMDRVVAELV